MEFVKENTDLFVAIGALVLAIVVVLGVRYLFGVISKEPEPKSTTNEEPIETTNNQETFEMITPAVEVNEEPSELVTSARSSILQRFIRPK